MNKTLLELRRLRWASLSEGATLILLVCLAVPLKRMAGMPEFVTVMGPVHGAAFLIYVAMVMRAASAGLITGAESTRLMIVAFIPFGAFFMGGMFKRKAQALTQATSSPLFTDRP
jgi:integral membrane protein